jgi:DNA polymerase-4
MPSAAQHARRILHVDCDAYFVQVARLEDPEGAGREELLLVGGAPGSRGVVTSASYESRAFGVRSGMPMSQALRLCPKAVCVPVPRGACSRIHREIREVLDRFTPVVEAASIDEFYLDLSGTEALYHDEPLQGTALRMRAAVLSDTRISVSIGGGAARLIAKLATGRAKPAGVLIVPDGDEADFLRTFKLQDIPGVGPRMAERLQHYGMHTVEHALGYDRATLRQLFGESQGAWLYDRIRGVDSAGVEARGAGAKSISRDETFAKDINDDEELLRELLALVVRAAGDLRGDSLRARTVTVRIRDGDFTTRQASRTLPRAIESDRAIYGVARTLFAKLRAARRTGARLLGVAVSNLTADDGPTQLAFFEENSDTLETERDRKLARTVDELRARFGSDIILPGNIID